MQLMKIMMSAIVVLSASAAQSEDSAIILGKSTFGARCSLCHGKDGKGGGEIAELFQVPPSDLTKLSERAGGKFPFSEVYGIIINGMEKKGHGGSTMPIWGEYFMSDALEDRGVNATDALYIAAGRANSVASYLELIQE